MGEPARAMHSEYLVRRLLRQERNLYGWVKFGLVAQELEAWSRARGGRRPRVLDVGCADRVAQRYLAEFGVEVDYFGVDREQAFEPHLVADARKLLKVRGRLPWAPEVILLLDVLEHLEGRAEDIHKVLAGCRELLGEGGLVLVAVPQMYRLDRFKLRHLHYREHKVRYTLEEWRERVGAHLEVERVQGLGYLSVLPYLLMAHPRYEETEWLLRGFDWLRGRVLEWEPLKALDLALSRGLGRVGLLQPWANDCLLVCRR